MNTPHTIYCPRKKGYIARGRCAEWRDDTCKGCPHIHVTPVPTDKTKRQLEAYTHDNNKWLIVKRLFDIHGERTIKQIAHATGMNKVVTSNILRAYWLKGVLDKKQSPHKGHELTYWLKRNG